MTKQTTPRALVLRAPGINCDRETAHACRQAGFETQPVHINLLVREPTNLLDYHLLVIPGGFSYGDDLGLDAAGEEPGDPPGSATPTIY